MRMERDFLSLGMNPTVSEETTDAALARNSPMQWPFSKKDGSSILSFGGVQEEKRTIGMDYRASNLSSAMKSAAAFDSAQKSIVSENKGGIQHTMTTHPTMQRDMHTFHHPVTNPTSLTSSPASTTCSFQAAIANSRKNPIGSQPLSAPSNTSVVGTTDLRNGSSSGAQMTIFYNGSVCVYDHVAPEKAQAIMLLAGNGPPAATLNTTPPPPSIPKSVPRPNVVMSHSISSSSNCPSPVPSRPVARSVIADNDANNVAKPSAVGISSSKNPEPVKTLASVAATTISPDAVPQFRRKSLARFLEKRKERVVCANPYGEKPDYSKHGAAV